MGYSADQLRQAINDILVDVSKRTGNERLYSKDAVELLMLIAAQESKLGEYMQQLGGGPALGIFQIEPNTATDVIGWCLRKPEYDRMLAAYRTQKGMKADLKYNLMYQVAVARVFLWRKPELLPSSDDVQGMADYWKKYHNTHLGKGKVSEAIENYNRLVLGKRKKSKV